MYFLGLQNVSSELPWYHFLREILVEKLFVFETIWGEISLHIFFVEIRLQTMFGRHVSSNVLW